MSWSQIASIRSMKIYTGGSGKKNANLYANGNHRIEVVAVIEAYDKNNKLVTLTQSEMYENIKLVNFLNEDLKSPFAIFSVPGDFGEAAKLDVEDVNVTNELDSNGNNYSWYLSVSAKDYNEYIIAIRCNAAGVEYTTAPENNNQNATVDYITVNILNEKTFNNNNIEIEKIQQKKYKVLGIKDLTQYNGDVYVSNVYIRLIDPSGSKLKKVKNKGENIVIRQDQDPVSSYWAVNLVAINSKTVFAKSDSKLTIFLNKNTNKYGLEYFIEDVITNELDGISILELPRMPYLINNVAKNPIPAPQEIVAYDQFGNHIRILCSNQSSEGGFNIRYTVR